MNQFTIKEKFTGYANIIIRAETEEEAIKLYDRGYYRDQDTFYMGRKYDHQFIQITEDK